MPEERLSPSDSDGEHLIVWSTHGAYVSELAAGWVNVDNTTQDSIHHGRGCAQGTHVLILRCRLC